MRLFSISLATRLSLVLLFIFSAFGGLAGERTVHEYQAEIIPQGFTDPAFKLVRVERPTPQGGIEVEVRTLDRNGEIALIEKAVLGAQGEVLDYSSEHRQLKHKSTMEQIHNENDKPDQLRMTYTASGKPSTVSQEPAPENVIVGASLIPYIFKHRQELLDGQELNIRLAVPERQDTYGFSLRHRGRDEWQGKEVIRIEMRPTSLIIRAMVDAMSFYMDLEAKTLVGYRGRMGVYLQKPGSTDWDAFSGTTRYQTPLSMDAMLQAATPAKKTSRPE
jgi:hypothetical protein